MNQKLKFPKLYSFHLGRNVKTGERTITTSPEKFKCMIENIKFSDLKRASWSGDMKFIVIDIILIHDEDELKNKLVELDKIWGLPATPIPADSK